MTNSIIYFDNNATTHLDPVVANRMHELNLAGISNPASQHRQGRDALHLLEEAKTQILELVGAPFLGMSAGQVILTSGGTEANNLAICGLLSSRPGIAIVGSTDHPSVIEPARALCPPERFRTLPVDSRGLCDPNLLSDWLQSIYAAGEQVSVVSLMLGNNETGVIQDLKTICGLCAKYDVPVHSDVVQAVGKIPVSMTDLGLSALSLTGHKIHGPVGIGALVMDRQLQVEPMIIGGGQQLGVRAGTEPVVPAVALALCLKQICDAREVGEFLAIESLRNDFEEKLAALADITVIAKDAPRLPHTSNVSFLGQDRQALHMALDLNGLACSTGSACASGSSRPSGSLVAMGLDEATVKGSLRFSFCRFSTASEVERSLEIIAQVLSSVRVPH